MNNSKYSPNEILQILNDFYNCQSVFDPEVSLGHILTFETTNSEWRTICDLIEPKQLTKYYYDLFKLNTPFKSLEDILSQRKNELKVFCNYLSENAVKQTVLPVIIMGQNCMTASIFRTLMNNLTKRGIDTQNIMPSSKLTPLFFKHSSILLEEVNKLVPGALSKFEYCDNWIVKIGTIIVSLFFLSIIVVPIIWHFHWALFIPLFIGITVTIIGNRFNPAKEVIGGYDTIRELILSMQAKANKPPEQKR